LIGPNGETTSQDEHEYGSTKPRIKSRIQRHLNTAIAIAGDYAELKMLL